MGKASMHLLSVILLLWFWAIADAQSERWGSGLEVPNYKSLRVVVEQVTKSAADIGLTEGRVRTGIELRLRQSGVQPISQYKSDEFLYTDIEVTGNVFTISLQFTRLVSYSVGRDETTITLGRTWQKKASGVHGRNPQKIIQGLDTLLDTFLNEYLKANAVGEHT